MKLHHVIEAQQFNPTVLQQLFDTALEMENVVAHGGTLEFQKRIMATLFYEPSTRTRFSFETAMHRLGGRVISTENAAEFSSVAKGETLEDTIHIINGYADVIVIRHHEVGAAKRAAAISKIPIINAGDGAGQHPTQALLDLYTIRKEIGAIDGYGVHQLLGDAGQAGSYDQQGEADVLPGIYGIDGGQRRAGVGGERLLGEVEHPQEIVDDARGTVEHDRPVRPHYGRREQDRHDQ